jgi:hypothetical protein
MCRTPYILVSDITCRQMAVIPERIFVLSNHEVPMIWSALQRRALPISKFC